MNASAGFAAARIMTAASVLKHRGSLVTGLKRIFAVGVRKSRAQRAWSKGLRILFVHDNKYAGQAERDG